MEDRADFSAEATKLRPLIPQLPLECNSGSVMSPLLAVKCRWCGVMFSVCWRCFRGQRYCCKACSRNARCRSHREAQRKYRTTDRGKEAHRQAERRRRMGRTKKIMADHTSTLALPCPILIKSIGFCFSCGREGPVVEKFPRRGYARRSNERYAC